MKNLFVFSLLLCIAIANSSCAHLYYQPGNNNVPLFTGKNQARVELQETGGNHLSGFELQTAYAITSHTALQLNLFHAGENDGTYGKGNGTLVDGAFGYYIPSKNKRWVFETYAGVGLGGAKNMYHPDEVAPVEVAKTSITKLYLQPSYGFTTKYFDIAASSKFSFVGVGVTNSTVTKEANPVDFDDVEYMKAHKSHFLWEPGFMLRGGFAHCKFLLAVTQVVRRSGKEMNLRMDEINTAFGIMVPFEIKQKKKAATL